MSNPVTRELQDIRSSVRAVSIAFVLAAACALPVAVTSTAQAQTYHVIYNFTKGYDGGQPSAGVTLDRAGDLYGTATVGGTYNQGTIFQLKRSGSDWTLSSLYSFRDNGDGKDPIARVVFGPNGSLYGTTYAGTVYNIRPPLSFCKTVSCPWTLTTLASDLQHPGYGDLAFDSLGNLYGTTSSGGIYDYGEVFELSPSNGHYTETAIYNFSRNDPGGVYPYNGVVFDNAGNLYGTTHQSGSGGYGAVFELSPAGPPWTESVLHAFSGNPDGGYLVAGVIFDQAQNLYGATSYYGPLHSGTIFELTPYQQWNFDLLYSMGSCDCNSGPYASLTIDASGNLYGTNYYNADHDLDMGSIFKLSPNGDGSWTYTDLHDFTGGSDGAYPISNVVTDAYGNLFGTASRGGTGKACGVAGCGIVWEITP